MYQVLTNIDLTNCKEGSSISCNGVCLTVKNIKNDNNDFIFEVNIGEETLSRTNLGDVVSNNKKLILKGL